eukprot:s562_g8.t1
MIGCVLAWWIINEAFEKTACEASQAFFGSWLQSRAAEDASSLGRPRAVTFPLREGELVEFIQAMRACSLKEATSEDAVMRWSVQAWMYLVFVGLNSLAGTVPRPGKGRWSAVESQAARSIQKAVEAKCQKDTEQILCHESDWKKDMASRVVSYEGEEIGVCEVLSLEQVLPALPPEGHGGSVDALDWVGPRTKEFLLNPKKLLKDPKDVVLPKMPGKVHVVHGDKLKIAQELVKRNVCDWVPLDKVYKIGGQPILNGLFGVKKPAELEDGRPILRLIMNLVGSNATQLQLEGGCESLPNITSWQSLVIEGNETLSCYQSDMSSAFYLFRLPLVWLPYLCFNLVVDGEQINGVSGQSYALGCKVIPMGWQNSVGIMQEISEHLMKFNGIGSVHQVCKGKVLPPWFSAVLRESDDVQRHWWHVYLDNFAAAERVVPSNGRVAARLCHDAAERAWADAGVVSSAKKRVAGQERIQELGAEVDGEYRQLGMATPKLVKLLLSTCWLLLQRFLNRKHVQIMAGRWVFGLQFRRPSMSILEMTWQLVGGSSKITQKLKASVRQELLMLVMMSPLFTCNLGAQVTKWVMASDASEAGGAIGVAKTLSISGKDFIGASESLDRFGGGDKLPILVLSLFNGIGGAFRAYDVAGILPAYRIAVEIDPGANRITSRRWPGTIIVEDVHLVTREKVQSWSRQFLGILEIHLWSGFPCTDLSGVKYMRENLEGVNSRLFYEIPRIRKLLQEEFGEMVIIRLVTENVASMDESAARTISEELETTPYLVDPVYAVPMRRPRFCWTTETLEGLFPDVIITSERYWKKVVAEAEYPDLQQWVSDGVRWAGGERGEVLPTCLKSIPRASPPPRPAGLQKCDDRTVERWTSDSFRYPPYQYQEKFVFSTDSTWRLVNANEKELLLGYGYRHTEICWSASKIKSNPVGFSDARNSYLGDSFSIYSFVMFAVACCKKFLPTIPYKHLAFRMGLAPGFRAHLRATAPLGKQLIYGTPSRVLLSMDGDPQSLNRLLLRRTNHTGSDIRVTSGEVLNSKVFPRQSVQAAWWHWEPLFAQKWKRKAHINVLELEALLLSVKYQVERFKVSDCRIFHFSDSYVTISVVPARAPPLTHRLVRGLAAYEMILGHLEMSALLLLSFHCLLRTGEALALVPGDLLLGQSTGVVSLKSTKSGKRNAATEAISITDQVVLETVRSLVIARREANLVDVPLWSGSGAAFRKRFAELCRVFDIERLGFRPYSLRRGGATDLFQRSHSMECALIRGRWESSRAEFLDRPAQTKAEEREMSFCTTSTMMRYLCATDGDANKALRAMKDSMEWRRRNLQEHLFLEGATLPTCRSCLKDPLSHCFLCIGKDVLGRHVIYSCTGRAANKTPEDGIEHMATELERLFQNSSMPGQIAWVLDFAGFGLADCNPKVAALALPMFASHYPERFGQIVCLSFPYAFYPLYAAGSRIFDKDTMAKVKILKSDKEWKRYGDAYWSHDPGMRSWLDEAVKCKGVPGSFPAPNFTEQLRRTPATENAIRILERCATHHTECHKDHKH